MNKAYIIPIITLLLLSCYVGYDQYSSTVNRLETQRQIDILTPITATNEIIDCYSSLSGEIPSETINTVVIEVKGTLNIRSTVITNSLFRGNGTVNIITDGAVSFNYFTKGITVNVLFEDGGRQTSLNNNISYSKINAKTLSTTWVVDNKVITHCDICGLPATRTLTIGEKGYLYAYRHSKYWDMNLLNEPTMLNLCEAHYIEAVSARVKIP